MEENRKGFTYYVRQERIDEYMKWSMERRLQWLLYGNKLRKSLPKRTIELQEAFRQGKI
jgi:hypothetical protein